MNNRIYKRHLINFSFIVCHLSLGVALTACSDTWDEHFEAQAPGVQDGSLWQAIKQNSNLSNFASVVEACGYDKSLNGSQVFTVFAPTNDSFSSSEASALIQTYNQEKDKVSDEDNTVIKEFLQNHIALFNHSVSASSNDSLVLMNGKYTMLTSGAIGGTAFQTSNQLYENGVLFTLNGKVDYEPNVFEYVRKDADLDSLSSFLYNDRFYRKEFQADKSVAGGFVDGKTVYLDSVFRQQNDLFESDFLGARLNQEDSTYLMLAPTNALWKQLIDEYSQYFNYDDQVSDRDSLFYTNPRMAILKGTVFSGTFNTDRSLNDSALSTNALLTSTMRRYRWGIDFLHYYQYGDGTGYNQLKPNATLFANTASVNCSNGQVKKASEWNINPLNTFRQLIIVEAEGQGSIQEVSKVRNTATQEMEETVIPSPHNVNSDNSFYNKVWGNSFVEFEQARTTIDHSATFNIRNVLSNTGYDIYLVAAPALANDSNATEVQRAPMKFRCTLGYHNQKGESLTEVLDNPHATTTGSARRNFTTTPDVVDYVLLAEDYKFECSSFGLEEESPQITLKVETYLTSAELRNNTYTRTLRIDCILLVPHGTSWVDDDYFYIAPHGDGVTWMVPKK